MAGREEEGAALARVQYARNFASNLESIEAFWLDNDFAQGYERLLDALTDVVVPNLQRHPRMGRHFLKRAVESVEAKRLLERIGLQLSALGPSAEVREYVMDEYLVLYLVAGGDPGDAGIVQLLAIKHHRQLGFDVPGSSAGI
ncbi:type II toxin-antitoxin system RelE/ParE family toxin [Variovorax paradoxus]|uniref:type II toxin-antitoxin system RelE/ParE family toxin n=1 Tax=Variovorax paradoxus TaxID=34073 RepID=UPI000377AEC7|nr:type II toxin-antitoxin system RelE/ParE family toxin [Variovorax paradoxus]